MKYVRWVAAAMTLAGVWALAADARAEAQELDASPPAASKPRAPRPLFAAQAAATAHPLEPHEREARRFLKEAAASSRFQADAARLALARTTNADVRSLAASLSADHQQGANDLLQMLHQRGLAAPMMENAQRKTLTRLARLKGPRFDREYVQAAIAQARQELGACDKAPPLIEDALLESWIERTVPALREEIDAGERLAARWPAAAEPPAGRGLRARRHHRAE
jgi:putative membrane protein